MYVANRMNQILPSLYAEPSLNGDNEFHLKFDTVMI